MSSKSFKNATKLNQLVNVIDYGAVGNGTADDTAALQAAFNAAYDLDGTIYLPPGDYKITANISTKRPLNAPAGVTISATQASTSAYPTIGIYFERKMLVENIVFKNVNVYTRELNGTDQLFTPTTFRACSFENNFLTLGQDDVITFGYRISECNFSSNITRVKAAIYIVNASNVTVEDNKFQEYQSAVNITPTISLSSTNININRNLIINTGQNSISMIGTSMFRISNVTIDGNTIVESIRDNGSTAYASIFGVYCCNVSALNNNITSRNTGIQFRATIGLSVVNNNISNTTTTSCMRLLGVRQVEIIGNTFDAATTAGNYAILILGPTSNQLYTTKDILIENNAIKGTSIAVKIESTDNVSVVRNSFTAITAISANGLLWFESTVTRGSYFDNRFYAPSGTPVNNEAGANVTNATSAQTLVVTAAPVSVITPPVITAADTTLNNAKSYLTLFTLGDATLLRQKIDDDNLKTMTEWMGTFGGTPPMLAWNSSAFDIDNTDYISDVIQNGSSFDNFQIEQYYDNKALVFIDSQNTLSCRVFNSKLTGTDYPIGINAVQIAEFAWNTASFRTPLVVDGAVYDAVGNGLVSNDAWNVVVSARMSIGQKADKTYVLLTVDGKTGISGCTAAQLAARLLALGCVNAFNLDGGGSSTLWYNGAVINTPSDSTGERPIPAIMYVA